MVCPPTRVKSISHKQVQTLLAAAHDDRNEALYVVALHTGLRLGEILGLKWADVDLDAGKFSVRRSLKVTANGLGFGPPKNKASRRSAPLNKPTVAALKAHRKHQHEERISASRWHDLDLVFPNRVGNPMDHNNLYHRDFKAALERAGLPMTFRFHDLRHTCATLLLSKNVNPKIVQEVLGHSNISQTMDTYSHVLPTMQEEAAAAIQSALS